MMDDQYWLEGKVSIPEEIRTEFNENVLKILRLCGIRKLKEIKVAGKAITVVREPKPDSKNIVQFDYSIFEKQKRELAFYDMNTCELNVTDRGYMEFGLAMNLVMTMLEAYSTEHCYLMKGNQVCDVFGCALLIEQMTGVRPSFVNRAKIWDMLVYLRSSERYSEITHDNLWDTFPYGYGEVDLEQLLACWVSSYAAAEKPKDYIRLQKSEIKDAKTMSRVYYTYELFQELIKCWGNSKVKDNLKNLLVLDIAERERLAQKENAFGDIAEVSLYELPASIVTAYGWAAQEEFWKVWFSLGITGYKEIYGKTDKDEKKVKEKGEQRERLFYKAIQRNNEDEFLEFEEYQELCLSNEMKMNLEEWKQIYETIDGVRVDDVPMETYVADVLLELQKIWGCRYMDEKVIKEFLVQSEDIRFKKALLVFREIMDRTLEYFPELTVGQVKEWVIKKYHSSNDRMKLNGYISLLTNRVRRLNLLGF